MPRIRVRVRDESGDGERKRFVSGTDSVVRTTNPILKEIAVGARVLVSGVPGSGRTPFLLSLIDRETVYLTYHRASFIEKLFRKLFPSRRFVFCEPRRNTIANPDTDVLVIGFEPSSDVEAILRKAATYAESMGWRSPILVVDSLIGRNLDANASWRIAEETRRYRYAVVGVVPPFLEEFGIGFDVVVNLFPRSDGSVRVVVSKYRLYPYPRKSIVAYVDGEGVIELSEVPRYERANRVRGRRS